MAKLYSVEITVNSTQALLIIDADDWMQVTLSTPCSGVFVQTSTGIGQGLRLHPNISVTLTLAPGDRLFGSLLTNMVQNGLHTPSAPLSYSVQAVPWTRQFVDELAALLDRRLKEQ